MGCDILIWGQQDIQPIFRTKQRRFFGFQRFEQLGMYVEDS